MYVLFASQHCKNVQTVSLQHDMMQHGTFKAEQIWRALQDNEVSKSENF